MFTDIGYKINNSNIEIYLYKKDEMCSMSANDLSFDFFLKIPSSEVVEKLETQTNGLSELNLLKICDLDKRLSKLENKQNMINK